MLVKTQSDLAKRIPGLMDARFSGGWSGLFTITPDWHPVLSSIAGIEGLYVAVGFSGHGFKLAPTLGESLASMILGKTPRLPIDMYSFSRFQEGSHLHGAYGIGSIS